MSETTQDTQQSTVRTPGPYPEGGQAIWNDFLTRFFGDEEAGAPGLLNQLQSANQYGANRWDQFYKNTMLPAYHNYTDSIDFSKGAGDRYQAAISPEQELVTGAMDRSMNNPISLSFGGQSFNLLPQGGVNMARDRYNMMNDSATRMLGFESTILPTLAGQRLEGGITPAKTDMMQDINNNPDMIEANYITGNLLPLATQMQGLRYGIPTAMSSGSSSGDTELGWPGMLGLGGNLLGNLGVDFSDLWGGLESAGGFVGDLFGNLFGNGGGNAGGSGGITWA